jgi:hypothetical protein
MMKALVASVALLACLLSDVTRAATANPAAAPAVLSREGQQRVAARQMRTQLAKDYVTARRRILSPYVSGLEKLAGWLIEQKAKTEAEAVLKELAQEDPENAQLAKLKTDAGGITAPQALGEAQKKDCEQRLASARRAGAAGLVDLARKCNNAGLVNYAYDILQDVMQVYPDEVTARTAMGFVKVGNEWLPTFVAAQQKRGLKYLPDIGWVPAQTVERIGKGEWCENGKWMKMDEADKLHASFDNPWIIDTENFTLKSTCTRKLAVRISEKLEAIRQCCFRQYLDFFLRGSGKKGAQMLFNLAAADKLVVNYYATKEDYVTAIKRGRFGDSAGLLERSAGFYSTGPHASFFFHHDWGNNESLSIMQHEVTHQILGEFSHGGGPVWLAEGMAETLEYAKPNADGWLEIPSGRKHPDVKQTALWLKANSLQPAKVLLGLTENTFHQEPNRNRNYKWAGAFCRFLLEFEDGVYATDFLEYGYDSYVHRAKTPVTDYLGLTEEALDTAFREYLKE